MINPLRTFLAQIIVHHLPGPRSLLVAAWGWLAAETDDLAEKQHCLEAILGLDPNNERAAMALLWVFQRQRATRNT